MSDINSLLSILEKSKPNGDGKWISCCPAHDDRSPSLAIKQTDDGKILLHCFTGCSVSEIVGVIGLELSDLMPDDPAYRKSGKTPKFNRYELFDKMMFEARILSIAIRQVLAGQELNSGDLKRVIQAENTIDDLAREVTR